MDLSDQQIENLVKITERANGPQLSLIKDTYKTIKSGSSNEDFRDNVFHGLMSNEINFNFFKKWAAHLFLNTPNTIYVYELLNFSELKELWKEKNFKKLLKKTNFLFNFSSETIDDIQIIDITKIEHKNQLLFSFISPSVIMKTKGNNDPVFNKELYFTYIWLDFDMNKLVISIPPHPNQYSVNNVLIKKKDNDKIAVQFLEYFKKEIHPLTFSEQDWIIPVLKEITNEYFHHNNPLITKKTDEFSSIHAKGIVDKLAEFDERLKNDFSKLRIKKEVISLIESELINAYGNIKSKAPFSIFLQEVDKGLTQYRANNGGNAFSFVDSRDIVKKMIENAQISALGLAFLHEGRAYSYKIYKSDYFFALKRVSTATTEKEIVDHVLLELIKYKQGVKSKHLSPETSETR